MWINRLIWLACTIGLGILVSYHGGRIPYFLFAGVLLLPVFMLIYLLYVRNTINFYQSFGGKSLTKGEPTVYELHVVNPSLLNYVRVRAEFFDDRSKILNSNINDYFYLEPGQEHLITSVLVPRCRGEYLAGAKKYYFIDPLGFFKLPCKVHSPALITVYPRMTSWQYENLIREDEDNKYDLNSNMYQDDRDVSLREYRSGDPQKKIHWKASARTSSLMVFKDADRSRKQILVLMDFCRSQNRDQKVELMEDAMLENMLSLLNYCVSHQLACRVMSLQKQLENEAVDSEKKLEDIYHTTALMPFMAEPGWEKLLSNKNQSSDCYLLVHTLDENKVRELLKFNVGIRVYLIFFGNVLNKRHKELLSTCRNSGITVLLPEYLKEVEHEQ